jgi:hypothetical protein
MSQSKRKSTLEAIINALLGYVINSIIAYYTMHALGYHITIEENLSIGVLFVTVSFIKTYLLRRLFTMGEK